MSMNREISPEMRLVHLSKFNRDDLQNILAEICKGLSKEGLLEIFGVIIQENMHDPDELCYNCSRETEHEVMLEGEIYFLCNRCFERFFYGDEKIK